MATLKGLWLINEKPATVETSIWQSDVSFTVPTVAQNGEQVPVTTVVITSMDSTGKIQFITGSGSVHSGYDYNTEEWTSDHARQWYFGEVEQEVLDEFYNWLTANATEQTHRLNGVWRFNDDIVYPEGDKVLLIFPKFKTRVDGKLYYYQMRIYGTGWSGGQLNYLGTRPYAAHSPAKGWMVEEFKTISYGQNNVLVIDDVYNFFIENATYIGLWSYLDIEMTSPSGVALATSGTFCNDHIRVLPRLQEKSVELTEEAQSITPDDGYAGLSKVEIPAGSTNSAEIKLQDKTVTENGTVTADEGYDGLGAVTVEVESSGSGSGGGTDALDALIDRSITEVSSEVTEVHKYLFDCCTALTSVSFPNATRINEYAFCGCTALTSVSFLEVTSVSNFAFRNCTALTSVSFPNATSVSSYMFDCCTALTSVSFPNATGVEIRAFNSCTALTSVSFPKVKNISNYAFIGCRLLTTIILRFGTVCSLSNTNAFLYCYHIDGTTDSTYNPTGAKDGYIYVPNALVASYRTATNWSTYASQIMPYVVTFAELADIDATTYDKAYVGETEKEYTYNGTEWEEYTR